MIKYLLYLLLITFIFIIYVEYSVGNIIWREGVKGFKQFQPWNIIHFLVNPLHKEFLWNIQLLDVNYVVFIVISTIIYHNV